MNKSSFGTHFTVTTWGESHGKALGAVVDGCPAGLSLCEEDIQKFLDRRKPSQSRYTTARKEGDLVEILSGIFEGKTTGTPISLIVRNTDQRSRDYGNIALSYRPGHADYTFDAKYGFRDYRGVAVLPVVRPSGVWRPELLLQRFWNRWYYRIRLYPFHRPHRCGSCKI